MQKSIEITTTQNVTIEYELAKLRERAVAWLLDTLIVAIGYMILVQLVRLIFNNEVLDSIGWGMVVGILPFVTFFAYHTLMEIFNTGQSVGKMVMSIKVVRLDGKDPEWSDVLLRAVLQLIDSIFSFGVIGALLIKTTAKGQRLGDMAANTTLIKIQGYPYQYRLQDILSISTLHNYEPVYPQVRHLSERDMIYIKSALSRFQKYPNRAHNDIIEDLVTELMPILQIEQRPLNRPEFLRTLLRDYIVLTR